MWTTGISLDLGATVVNAEKTNVQKPNLDATLKFVDDRIKLYRNE